MGTKIVLDLFYENIPFYTDVTVKISVLSGIALQVPGEENESQEWHPAESQLGCHSL